MRLSTATHEQVVLAVLLVDGRYALQLRDRKPGVVAPGMWSFFGGKVEGGERADCAVAREIQEELCIGLKRPKFLFQLVAGDHRKSGVISYSFFESDVSGVWNTYQLKEGASAAVFTYHQARRLRMPSLIRRVLDLHYHIGHSMRGGRAGLKAAI